MFPLAVFALTALAASASAAALPSGYLALAKVTLKPLNSYNDYYLSTNVTLGSHDKYGFDFKNVTQTTVLAYEYDNDSGSALQVNVTGYPNRACVFSLNSDPRNAANYIFPLIEEEHGLICSVQSAAFDPVTVTTYITIGVNWDNSFANKDECSGYQYLPNGTHVYNCSQGPVSLVDKVTLPQACGDKKLVPAACPTSTHQWCNFPSSDLNNGLTGGHPGTCVPLCSYDHPCGPGYACYYLTSAEYNNRKHLLNYTADAVCTPTCTQNSDCASNSCLSYTDDNGNPAQKCVTYFQAQSA